MPGKGAGVRVYFTHKKGKAHFLPYSWFGFFDYSVVKVHRREVVASTSRQTTGRSRLDGVDQQQKIAKSPLTRFYRSERSDYHHSSILSQLHLTPPE
jgi:hypothetical protein